MIDTGDNLFRSEYEREMETWLARRLRYFCIACMIFAGLLLLLRVGHPGWGLSLAEAAAAIGVAAYFMRRGWIAPASRERILKSAYRLILILGVISLGAKLAGGLLGVPSSSGVMYSLFFWHLTACAFLPWSPRESLRALLPLFLIALGLGAIVTYNTATWFQWAAAAFFTPFIFLPGLAICWWRLSRHGKRFRTRMVGKHFFAMREELARARGIHDSVFPQPHEDAYLRFNYSYKPMREMGGDYIHVHATPDGLMHVTLIDVTGHGLAAALTVNRLYGELERIRAEMPDADPSEILNLLNHYFNLTLTKHMIYATAACASIDPVKGILTWASAGHPPAFLRGAGGNVTELPATTLLLGAVPHDVFAAASRKLELVPGDVLVMYTDGAFEARDSQGEQIGLDELRRLIRTSDAPQDWPRFIAATVDRHTGGANEDDVLIASIRFKAHRPHPSPAEIEAASLLAGQS